MSPRFWSLLAVVCLFTSQFVVPTASRADSYQLFNLGPDNSMSFLGLSSTGQAFFQNNGVQTNYYTYFDGIRIATSTTAPTFVIDNGGTVGCPSLPSGYSAFLGAKCNNGYEAFTGNFQGGPFGVFTVAGSSVTNISPANPPFSQFGGSGLWINSIGDIVIDDGFNGNWWMAVDQNTLIPLPTPEPSSLIFLATGIAAGAGLVRRKLLV